MRSLRRTMETMRMNDVVASPLKLMGVPIEAPSARDMRIALLLWGSAGAGKTTLAATAPGRKLVLMCDPDGELSLVDRDDIQHVMRLYVLNPLTAVQEFKKPDPYGLTRFLTDHPEIETVI